VITASLTFEVIWVRDCAVLPIFAHEKKTFKYRKSEVHYSGRETARRQVVLNDDLFAVRQICFVAYSSLPIWLASR